MMNIHNGGQPRKHTICSAPGIEGRLADAHSMSDTRSKLEVFAGDIATLGDATLHTTLVPVHLPLTLAPLNCSRIL